MKYEIEIHPLNAIGKYYIDQNSCTCDDLCLSIAPKNFGIVLPKDGGINYYVSKQPETLEEEQLCKEAMDSCAVEAIHDDGEDLKLSPRD